jgi:hypothetical protein
MVLWFKRPARVGGQHRMARLDSRDLRDRAVGSMSAAARAGRPRAIRGGRGQRGEAGTAPARDRQRGGQADERLATAALAERAGVSVGAVGREAGHDRITAPLRHRRTDQRHHPSRLGRAIPAAPLSRGDIVSDNLGSHQGTAVRRLIRDAGRQAVLPARYSPDLNPIEQVFAKLKTLLRRPAHYRGHWAWHRRAPRPLHSRGMRQLPRQCRLCCRLTGSRSMVSRTRLGAAVADGEHLDLLDAGGGAQFDDVALPRL